MQKLTWTDRFPDQKLENGLPLFDNLLWHIKLIKNPDKTWSVYAGECLIYWTDTKESLDAFLYGLGLTYVSMDGALLDSFSKETKKFVLGDDAVRNS